MKNGTLLINHNAKFQEDIWQTNEDWEMVDWNKSIRYQADVLQNLYDELSETEEYSGGCEELYVLGDVINMLNSIDVIIGD